MDQITIYTSITPNYDKLRKDDAIQIPPLNIFNKSVMNAKIIKLLSHYYINSNISIWIDGNVHLYPNFNPIELLEDYDIVLMRHPQRNCIYQEEKPALKRILNDLEGQEKIKEQINYYKSINFPNNFGLWYGGFIIRRHNQQIIDFNNAWWSEICRFSYRDQLSLPVIISRFPSLKLKTLDMNLYNNPIFKKKQHGK